MFYVATLRSDLAPNGIIVHIAPDYRLAEIYLIKEMRELYGDYLVEFEEKEGIARLGYDDLKEFEVVCDEYTDDYFCVDIHYVEGYALRRIPDEKYEVHIQ